MVIAKFFEKLIFSIKFDAESEKKFFRQKSFKKNRRGSQAGKSLLKVSDKRFRKWAPFCARTTVCFNCGPQKKYFEPKNIFFDSLQLHIANGFSVGVFCLDWIMREKNEIRVFCWDESLMWESDWIFLTKIRAKVTSAPK